MSDLTDFLLACIAEDEAVARAAIDGTALWGGWAEFADFGVSARASAHALRHAPARVLAECEAKRRIVDEAIYYGGEDDDSGGWAFGVMLRNLALPYADHPDYREEWRP